jgi:hypothetical protein
MIPGGAAREVKSILKTPPADWKRTHSCRPLKVAAERTSQRAHVVPHVGEFPNQIRVAELARWSASGVAGLLPHSSIPACPGRLASVGQRSRPS